MPDMGEALVTMLWLAVIGCVLIGLAGLGLGWLIWA